MRRYALHPDAAYRVIDDHVFIITPDGRQHELNGDVELAVWHLCEKGPQTEAGLLDLLVTEFEVDRGVARADLESFLNEMIQVGVMEKNS